MDTRWLTTWRRARHILAGLIAGVALAACGGGGGGGSSSD
jgi:hypothetical protein